MSVLDELRKYEKMRAAYESNQVIVWPDLLLQADRAIRDLKAMVEKAEYAAKENREAMDNAVAAWKEAEAAHADLKRLTESLDGDRTLDRIRELEAEVARLTWMLDASAGDMKALLENEAYEHGMSYETTVAELMASLAARYEADAIIPLNEEQAEAFKALSESIKTEQSLRAEVAELRARPRGIGDGDIQALFDRVERAEAEVERLTKELSRYRRNCTCEL